MINSRSKPAAIILAGGKSSRIRKALPLGVYDKCFLPLKSKPLLLHVLEGISLQADPILINANSNPELFLDFNLPIIPDANEDFSGPLAGILAGMSWAQHHASKSTHIFTVSTDVPFLPSDLIIRLQMFLQKEDKSIILARSDGKIHPVIGLWPTSQKKELENALKAGVRKVLDWTRSQRTIYVDIPMIEKNGEIIDPFFNINTPADLEKAEEIFEILKADPKYYS